MIGSHTKSSRSRDPLETPVRQAMICAPEQRYETMTAGSVTREWFSWKAVTPDRRRAQAEKVLE